MKYVEAILEDLKTYAAEFAADQTSQEEFSLKIDLLIGRVERIEINFVGTWLRSDKKKWRTHTDIQPIFKQLLFQRKFRAVEALRELQQPKISKRAFNHRIRKILAAKLFFSPLETSVRRNMVSYHEKNGGYILKNNIQIFIEGDSENDGKTRVHSEVFQPTGEDKSRSIAIHYENTKRQHNL